MRIVYLDADFIPATGETGPRSYALARRLIERGHDVHMLTSDRRIGGAGPSGGAEANLEGIPVSVVRAGLARSGNRVGKLWHHLRFALGSARRLLRGPRPDVVFVTSPPLSSIIPAVATRRLRGVPFVLEVREVWPEVPYGIDLIRSRLLVFVLRRLALLGYRAASKIIALTEPAMHHIQADVPLTRKVVKVGPCCDLDRFAGGSGAAIREQRGWGAKFVALYAGPLIRSAGIEAILRVADVVREDDQFVFWIVGGGEHRAELERNIHDRELHNVVIDEPAPDERLADVIAAADLCLMTVRHVRILEQANSDRLFDYLAAGKPVLLNYGGWQRELLESHGAGLGVPLGHHGEFFEHICHLCDDAERRAEMGRNARHLAETLCHPDRLAGKLEDVLLAAAGRTIVQPAAVDAGTPLDGAES